MAKLFRKNSSYVITIYQHYRQTNKQTDGIRS